MRDLERFWERVEKTENCWFWKGALTKGRGVFYLTDKRQIYAQRYSYELLIGPIPTNRRILQTCKNKHCVNPAHLYLKTSKASLRPKRKSDEERFWDKVQKLSDWNGGCWIWTAGRDRGGYGTFTLKGMPIRATHYSWQLHTGQPVPKWILVCHHCDNPSCVNPRHLFLGTSKDNADDRAAKGRSASGEKHPLSKLTQEQVDEIRADTTTPSLALAKRYGVRHRAISQIRRNKAWNPKHTLPVIEHPGIRKKSKVDEDKVREIRALASSGISTNELVLRFGVNASSIRSIVRRATWKKVSDYPLILSTVQDEDIFPDLTLSKI